MKKRILLLMTIGMSFAQPVMGSEILGGRKVVEREPGEMRVSQVSRLGIKCDHAVLDKNLQESSGDVRATNGKGKSSSAL